MISRSYLVAVRVALCFALVGPAYAGTVQTKGAGSAVKSVDRSVTFDNLDFAGQETPLSNYRSGGLYVRTNGNSFFGEDARGTIFSLGIPFNPFHLTTALDHSYVEVGGGFYFPYEAGPGNFDWVTIETDDSRKIYAVEFLYGNGWTTGQLTGPYPWGNSTAYLEWKALVGGQVVASGQVNALEVGSVVGFRDPDGFDQLMIRAPHSLPTDPNMQELAMDDLKVSLSLPPASLPDIDGDGRSDISVWQRADSAWSVSRSSDGLELSILTDALMPDAIPVPGDYDGDLVTDLAVWQPYEGNWYVYKSTQNFSGPDALMVRAWGTRHAGDIAVPGDYDGDRITDIAVWRGPQGMWYVLKSSDGGMMTQQWGDHSLGDVPVPGDYDGDGKTDFAVWRAFEGVWSILQSSNGSTVTRAWGTQNAGDIAVPGDYDGDGRTDIAVWRSYEGYWYIYGVGPEGMTVRIWGTAYAGDIAVPADYDGDGITDIAVWREPTSTWYILRSSDGMGVSYQWGTPGDIPLPSAFNGKWAPLQ